MGEIYKRFAQKGDFSDEAAQSMFDYESGRGKLPAKDNGYLIGKHVMDLTVQMWREDITNESPTLTKWELYQDYPEWWLKKIGIENWVVRYDQSYVALRRRELGNHGSNRQPVRSD